MTDVLWAKDAENIEVVRHLSPQRSLVKVDGEYYIKMPLLLYRLLNAVHILDELAEKEGY